MDSRSARWILIILFVLTAGARIALSMESVGINLESYLSLRQAEHIAQTGLPFFDDPLGYGGRALVGTFLFAYLLVPGVLLGHPEMYGNVISQIFASTLVFFVYAIMAHTTNRKAIALLVAAAAGFVPIYAQATMDVVHPITLAIPLLAAMTYMFMRIDEKVYARMFIVSSVVASVLHPLSLVFVLSCAVYLLLCKLDKVKLVSGQTEAIIFSALLTVWTHIIIYREALIAHGMSALSANTPEPFISAAYGITSLTDVLYGIGVIPVFFGVYMIYRSIHIEKENHLYLLFSLILTAGVLIAFKAIPTEQGLVLVGIGFLVLFGRYLEQTASFLKATHFAPLKRTVFLVLIFFFILFTIVPSLNLIKQQPDNRDAFEWIESHAQKGAVIIAPAEYGHRIAYQEHATIADTSFLLAPDVQGRIDDIDLIYNTKFVSQALQIAQKYDAKYLLVSQDIKNRMGIENVEYVDEECFRHAFKGSVEILEIECEVAQHARVS